MIDIARGDAVAPLPLRVNGHAVIPPMASLAPQHVGAVVAVGNAIASIAPADGEDGDEGHEDHEDHEDDGEDSDEDHEDRQEARRFAAPS
eukprot:5702297-Pyramimonas_sp.AAC.1